MARRLLWTLGLGLIGLVLVLGAVSVRDALAVRASLNQARRALEGVRGATSDLDIGALQRALNAAQSPIERATARSRSLALRIAGKIPIAGRSARVVSSLADSAATALQAAKLELSAAGSFPRTGDKLDYRIINERIDLTPWTSAEPLLRAASKALRDAREKMRSTPSTWVLPQVARARSAIGERLDELARASDGAAAAGSVIPGMFGGTKTYLLAFQNPAEARATGGLIGGFALIRVSKGRLSLQSVASNFALTRAKQAVDMPDWFKARYDRFDARRLWSSVNLDPDFRVTGSLIAKLFERTVGPHVDGVIAMDPTGLAELLRVTGPVAGPSGKQLEASTIEALVMSDSYRLFADEAARKQFFVEAAGRIWRALLSGGNLKDAGRALARASRGRHVMIWSSVDEVERGLTTLGVDGGFLPTKSFVRLTTQNASANKIDFYLRRRLSVNASLRTDGSAVLKVIATLSNTAPKSGLPKNVAGPDKAFPQDPPGMNRSYVSLFLPPNSEPSTLQVAGAPVQYAFDRLPMATVVSAFVAIPAGSDLLLTLSVRQPTATIGCGRFRQFDLSFEAQPMPIPDLVTVESSGPGGFRRVWGRKDFNGTLDRPLDYQTAFAKPFWRRLSDGLAFHRPPECRTE